MYENPRNFDDTLFENQLRRDLGFIVEDTSSRDSSVEPPERVSAFVEVNPGVGLGNEAYRRVGSYPTSQNYRL